MSEYRIPLEGGDVLVVSVTVEQAAQIEDVDPENIGVALLKALGLNRPTIEAPRKKFKAAPQEPTAEEWLESSSRAALGKMK